MHLDMNSAFDAMNWPKIIGNIERAGLQNNLIMTCQSLSNDHIVNLDSNQYKTEKGTQDGKAPFGLWKIRMNDMLIKLNKIKNSPVVAFADDCAVV